MEEERDGRGGTARGRTAGDGGASTRRAIDVTQPVLVRCWCVRRGYDRIPAPFRSGRSHLIFSSGPSGEVGRHLRVPPDWQSRTHSDLKAEEPGRLMIQSTKDSCHPALWAPVGKKTASCQDACETNKEPSLNFSGDGFRSSPVHIVTGGEGVRRTRKGRVHHPRPRHSTHRPNAVTTGRPCRVRCVSEDATSVRGVS